MRWTVLLLLLIPAIASADETHALAMAVVDSKGLSPEDAIFTRWLWWPKAYLDRHGEVECVQSLRLALALNSWSLRFNTTDEAIVYPFMKNAETGDIVLRFNLKDLALDPGDPTEVDKLVDTFELLQFDPALNLIITEDDIEFAERLGISLGNGTALQWTTVDSAPYVQDGKTYRKRYSKRGVHAKVGDPGVEVVRITSDYLRQQMGELIDITQSQAPIVSAPYFVARIRSLKDEKKVLWNTLYGGIYYNLAGIPANEVELLKKLDAVKSAAFDRLQPDRRAWLLKSGVTKSERLVEAIPTRATSLAKTPYYLVTRDLARSSINKRDSFRQNLFKEFDLHRKEAKTEDGGETYFAKQNGLPGMTISNDKRVFVEVVLQAIASADNRPSFAKTRELEAPMDCLHCHVNGSGFQRVQDTFAADVRAKRVTFLDDLDLLRKYGLTRDQAQRRVENWTADDFEATDGILPRARKDFALGVIRVTGKWKDSKTVPKGLDIVSISSTKLFDIFADATWADVDAHRAYQELGVVGVKKEGAAEKFKMDFSFPGILPQPIIDLSNGHSIARNEFDLLRSILATYLRRHKK